MGFVHCLGPLQTYGDQKRNKSLDAIVVKKSSGTGMVLTNFDGVGIGFGFGVGCGFGIGWGFGGMPLNALGLGAGGGCGVGVGLGWGFGTGFGSQYRSSRVTFQGVEFNRKSDNEGVDSDLSKPKVRS